MPTRYRRASIVLDPELSDALAKSAARLRSSTEAGRLKELALIGARAVCDGDAEVTEVRRALDELGATREDADLLTISRALRRRRGRAGETPSESLEWVRGSR